MIVLKFGGTSVANAQNIQLALNIVSDKVKIEKLAVVVSALSGVTDMLLMASKNAAAKDEMYKTSIEEIKQKHEHRTDLINSMERSLADLQEVKISYDAMEKELRAALQQNFRLEKLLQEEKFKVLDLQLQLQTKNYEL